MADSTRKNPPWTATEKAAAREWQPRIRLFREGARQLVLRISTAQREVQEEAREIARRMDGASEALLALEPVLERRKSPTITPQDARDKLRAFDVVAADMMAFTNRPEVQAAIDADERSIRERGDGAERAAKPTAKGGSVQDIAEQVTLILSVAIRLGKTGSEVISPGMTSYEPTAEDWAILRRLALVHFIRLHYLNCTKNRKELDAFLMARSEATMHEVLLHALRVEVARGTVRDLLLSTPVDRIGRMVGDVSTTTANQIREWLRAGVMPSALGKGYFEILGRDYSLEARPA